ncbi:MAG: hypothetical protein RL557_923 [archaeon]|jgi:hypothetical protein
MKTFNKQGQHEIAGFVIIVLIVSVIGVIFLSIAFSKSTVSEQHSAEISHLLSSSMYVTSSCAINYVPQYRDMQDLIKECYKDPDRTCFAGMCAEGDFGAVVLEKDFTLSPKQGPWEHTSSGGSAQEPTLLLSDIQENQKIVISDIRGTIEYVFTNSDCRNGPHQYYGYPAMAGFYDDNKQLIQEVRLKDLEKGVSAPAGATALYSYIREEESYIKNYGDNYGQCSFTLHVFDGECTFEKERKLCDVLAGDLTGIVENSLHIGEDAPNKAYLLDIFYSSRDESVPSEELLTLQNGNFVNCTSIIGGGHSIAVSSLGGGTIEVALGVCKG